MSPQLARTSHASLICARGTGPKHVSMSECDSLEQGIPKSEFGSTEAWLIFSEWGRAFLPSYHNGRSCAPIVAGLAKCSSDRQTTTNLDCREAPEPSC